MNRLAKKQMPFNRVSQILFSGVNARNIDVSPEEVATPVLHGYARSVGGGAI